MHTSQYDRIITNVSRANRLNQIVKIDVSNEIWDIVAGKKPFKNGSQYEILRRIRTGIGEMRESTQVEKNRQLLDVALRAVGTLQKYVDMLGEQMDRNAPVADNEKTLEEVRGVSALIYDILQDFIVAEIESAAQTNESIKSASTNLTIIQVLITALVVVVAVYALVSVSESIRQPIHDMEVLSSEIAAGNLKARAVAPHVDELDHLTENLNIMAGKIQGLIDENTKEQQNLQKAEMKTLQAQITPHFLYNTFDTIIWLAESGQNEQVIEITKAFSEFFRISLSKGHDWISVDRELDHVRNYLTIQKIRYSDILDYSIESDSELSGEGVLKLILQPLVENAIYHGIKNKRGRGSLDVSARRTEDGGIRFSVSDNGIGFTPERLAEVKRELSGKNDTENLKAAYGLYNVNKRLTLYYDESVKLDIQSEYGNGTTVTFCVPHRDLAAGKDDV